MASEGIVLNAPEKCPVDPYTQSREQPHRSYKTPSDFDKLKQFLELDRKVLRFYCILDDRDSMFGEVRPVVSICFVYFVLFCFYFLRKFLKREYLVSCFLPSHSDFL